MINVLLQTTIAATVDDWSIARFSLLAQLLQDQKDEHGRPMFNVTARDRDPPGAPDSVLSGLDRSGFHQLWLFAVDTGQGLTGEDCRGISNFHRGGGGLMIARDHMNLGSSVCGLAGVGAAHHFHSYNIDPDARPEVDDPFTTQILWPNFHSGANGDYQLISASAPLHPVLQNPDSPTGVIRHLPSHPHEGAVSAPPGQKARVIATGISKITGRSFNIAVAFAADAGRGRAIAESTFHHFADYNWDPRMGAPSFVTESSGQALAAAPAAVADVHRYVSNVASWLAAESPALGRRERKPE